MEDISIVIIGILLFILGVVWISGKHAGYQEAMVEVDNLRHEVRHLEDRLGQTSSGGSWLLALLLVIIVAIVVLRGI